MKTTYIYIKLLFAIILLCTCNACNNISAGSYAYSEKYELKIKESDLIRIIQKFKLDFPDFCIPKECKITDGRSGNEDYWYHIYFFYKEENCILYTWVRQKDKEITIFSFVAINDGLKLGNWKDINKDFTDEENKKQKEKFEKRILNIIKSKIR